MLSINSKPCYRSRIILLFALFILVSCGGGSSSDSSDSDNSSVSTGVFIDSAVMGLRFETATQAGITDAAGTFMFVAGETVSFYIGDILLGSAAGEAQLTPLNLVPGAVDATNPQVVNILRFVQSLDQDGNPDNGIVISSAVTTMATGQSLDFSLSTADFEIAANALVSFVTSGSVPVLISALDAVAHFELSLGIGNSYGSLAFTGADSAAVGNTFEPTVVVDLVNPTVGSVSWAGTPGRGLTMGFNDSEVTTISFASPASAPDIYAYSLICNLAPPAACAGITLNLEDESLSFVDTELPVGVSGPPGPTNLATAPLTVNGEINWK